MREAKELIPITEAPGLKGKRVLLRASLNVPLVNDAVRNTHRIDRAQSTIDLLKKAGARVILIGHIGRDPSDTLYPVYEELRKRFKLTWCDAVTGPSVITAINALEDGDVLMLENLRRDPREAANDDGFARELAAYADIFVNDAFSVSHRMHASIVGIPKYLISYAGMLFMDEYKHLSFSREPEHPSFFALGGAKFETKMPLIESYLERYDHVFIGGALANDVLKARGFEVGVSMVSNVDLTNSPLIHNKKLILPIDVTVYGPNGKQHKQVDAVSPEETILDAGPKTITFLKQYVENAKTVLWNGPFGDYERGFYEQTEAFARLLADVNGCVILGGGDTVASIESLKMYDAFDFVSTAGGAMLKFLEKGTLPGIDALRCADMLEAESEGSV